MESAADRRQGGHDLRREDRLGRRCRRNDDSGNAFIDQFIHGSVEGPWRACCGQRVGLTHGEIVHRVHLSELRSDISQMAGPMRLLRRMECHRRRGAADTTPKGLGAGKGRNIEFVPLDGASKSAPRLVTGVAEFDRVTGGGLVPGSAIWWAVIRASVNRRSFSRWPARSRRNRHAPISRARKRSTRSDARRSAGAGGSIGSARAPPTCAISSRRWILRIRRGLSSSILSRPCISTTSNPLPARFRRYEARLTR